MTTMTNQPLVSIIVPVYRAEKYIHQCVESILAQTYSNIEVILVDDGSPDRCGEICDEYAAQDCRVKVIHQQNGGVSVARQTGIEHATGVYSIHADPDDWVDPTMIEEMVAKAKEDDADMVICDFFEENGTNRNCQHLAMESAPSPAIIEKRLIHHELSGYLWNKMFRRECCGDIDFPSDITLLEDELFIIRVLRTGNIKRVAYLPKAFYHYRTDNTSSIIHVRSERNLNSLLKVLDYMLEITGSCNESDDWVMGRKKVIMGELFLMKRFKQLLDSFPEVHQLIINEQPQWNLFRPGPSGLSMALQGHPHFGYYGCVINQLILNFAIKIKLQFMRIFH